MDESLLRRDVVAPYREIDDTRIAGVAKGCNRHYGLEDAMGNRDKQGKEPKKPKKPPAPKPTP